MYLGALVVRIQDEVDGTAHLLPYHRAHNERADHFPEFARQAFAHGSSRRLGYGPSSIPGCCSGVSVPVSALRSA